MKFDKMQFVYIDVNYLKRLNEADPEIFYDENKDYTKKPHLGILLNNEGREYVIPLTSAKEKHKDWKDVGSGWYRIYEVIDTTNTTIKSTDVIVDIKNQDILNKIPVGERMNYKQRILSVLDVRKMFPVKKGVYTKIKFQIKSSSSQKDNQRMFLMIKEYRFLRDIQDKIEEKADKIYSKQIEKGKVLKYHCDYKKLESVCDSYI